MNHDPDINNWSFNLWQEPTILVSSFLSAVAIIIAIFIPGWLTFILLGLTLAVWIVILNFFRDPDRVALDQPGLVVGPCDGKVVSIDLMKEEQYMEVDTIRVGIFLSLFDVHVQRIPLAGEVTMIDYKPGKFLQAFRPEASDVNEFIAMQINTPYGNLLVKQIAGILARRCIKFGSRVDLFLPSKAIVEIAVGDKVIGGLTPIAQLPSPAHE